MTARRIAASGALLAVGLHTGLALADQIPTRMPVDSSPAASPPERRVYSAWESGPPILPYRDDAPVPSGYRLEERTRTGLVVSGAIVLGVPYVIGLGATSPSHGDKAMNWLFIPAVGPWMALGLRHTSCTPETEHEVALCHAGDAFAIMGLIVDGIMQTTGATLLIVGLTVPKKVYVRKDMVEVTLIRVPSGSGLGVQGTF